MNDTNNNYLDRVSSKFQLAFNFSHDLDSIIYSHNLLEKTGYNQCLISCLQYLNDISKGEFNKALELVSK